jgi:hypothetical protein
MDRIEGQIADQKQLAKQALSWITCARRPLTTIELQHALGVEAGESKLDEENLSEIEDIVSLCAGLVTIDEESGIIRLVHYTTQEYFKRTQNQWFPDGESDITKICLTYLSFHVFESGCCQNDEEFEQRLQLNPLYDYASHNWGYHAREAYTLTQDLNQAIIDFFEKKSQLEASIQALLAINRWPGDFGYSQECPRQVTGLHLAVYFGVETIVELLLKNGADIEATRSDGWTPLFWAANNGRVDVAKILLDKGAGVEATDKTGWTPLFWAANTGHVDMINLLVEKGADIEAADINEETPLSAAVISGNIDAVKLLLEKGANIDAANKWGVSPIYTASDSESVDVLNLLLEKGADIEAVDIYGETPLCAAMVSGNIDVVKLLLEKGANIKAANNLGETPLQKAKKFGRVDVVKLLIDKAADIEACYQRMRRTCFKPQSEQKHMILSQRE